MRKMESLPSMHTNSKTPLLHPLLLFCKCSHCHTWFNSWSVRVRLHSFCVPYRSRFRFQAFNGHYNFRPNKNANLIKWNMQSKIHSGTTSFQMDTYSLFAHPLRIWWVLGCGWTSHIDRRLNETTRITCKKIKSMPKKKNQSFGELRTIPLPSKTFESSWTKSTSSHINMILKLSHCLWDSFSLWLNGNLIWKLRECGTNPILWHRFTYKNRFHFCLAGWDFSFVTHIWINA